MTYTGGNRTSGGDRHLFDDVEEFSEIRIPFIWMDQYPSEGFGHGLTAGRELCHLDQRPDQNDQDRSATDRQEEFWNPPSEWNLLLLGREDRDRGGDEVDRCHGSKHRQQETERPIDQSGIWLDPDHR